jgi:thiosulfate reductase/polysulfide reductase chain A
MGEKTHNARAAIYRFLSLLYQDEIPLALIEKMGKGSFFERLAEMGKNSAIEGEVGEGICSGLSRMSAGLQSGSAAKVYNELRYEYADLFLNAGKNPVFPYASCHISGTPQPLVMQEPLFQVRKAYFDNGLHKNSAYQDLDDHIAVELEFMACLAGQTASDLETQERQEDFLRNHLHWADTFCEVLGTAAKTEFYQGLAELTKAVLSADSTILSKTADAPEKQGCTTALEQLGRAIAALEPDQELVTLAPGTVSPEADSTVKTHCYICVGLCGQEIKLRDKVITGCKGLAGDPKGGGRLCIKGANAHKSTYSAYRLKTPLIRENNRFRKASWDEALKLTVERLKSFDPKTVGFHRGNDFNSWCHEAVMAAYGTPNTTTHRQMCDIATRVANEHCFSEKRPWIDYAHSEFILLFGINELATEWVPILPGTDGAMALAMCFVLVIEELYDKDFVEEWCYGFAEFKKRLLGEEDGIARNPYWAEEICGVPAATIDRLAREFAATAPAAGALSWTGVAQVPNAVHATQAIQALNALMGCFDAPGGPGLIRKFKLASPWSDEQAKPPNNAEKFKLNSGRLWSGWIPAYFEKDVQAGWLKAMLCYFGNPVMSDASEPSVRRAVEQLEFSCAIDCYMSNTAELCDVILPDCTYLEQSRVVSDWMYESFLSLGQKAIEPMYASRSVVAIFSELAERLGFGKYFSWKNEDEYMENQLRGQQISLKELRKTAYVITDPQEFYKYREWGSLNPPSGYGSSGKSVTGKYNFINPAAEKAGLNALPDYIPPHEDWPELEPDAEYPMIIGYFRVLEHEHTATCWNPALMKQRGDNPVWINYLDAQNLGIADGDEVSVASPWGEVRAAAKVTWDIRQGGLATAGGFGGRYGLEGDPKFSRIGGFNTNVLLPPNLACKWSGTPPLKYIKSRIQKA